MKYQISHWVSSFVKFYKYMPLGHTPSDTWRVCMLKENAASHHEGNNRHDS